MAMKPIWTVGLIAAFSVLACCATVKNAQVWTSPEIGSREDAIVTGTVIAYYRGRFVGRITTVGFEVKATDSNTGEVLWKASHSRTTRWDYDYDPALLAGEVARELVQGLSTSASVKDHEDISDIAYSIGPFEDANAEEDKEKFPEAAKIVSGAFETAFLQSGYRVVSKGKAELLKKHGTKVGTSAIASDNQLSAATAGSDMSWEDGRDEKVWKDDLISIRLDEIVRMDKMPDGLPAHLKVPPKEGHNYLKIVLTLSLAENIYLTLPNFYLIDSESREYKQIIMNFTGYTLKDPRDVSSLLYCENGATFTGFYEVPVKAKPSSIIMNYNYLKSLKDNKKEGKRQIKIKISLQSDNLSSQQHKSLTSEPICPISCFADSKGWEVNFKCEEKPQMVRKTYHKGYQTSFLNGKPHSQGDVEFKYEKSGNNYLFTVKTWPCVESSTGYCIELEATGGTLGNNLSTCRNF